MEKLLYINSCIHTQQSRTNRLAKEFLAFKQQKTNVEIEELCLEQCCITGLDQARLALRNDCCAQQRFDQELFDFAKQFQQADSILIAAPYWDMSFPAILKTYIENICVCGLTFYYDDRGIPKGLCKAKELIYITTSGGPIGSYNFGFDYIKGLCDLYFHIPNVRVYSAEGLDIWGNDPEAILLEAKNQMIKKEETIAIV